MSTWLGSGRCPSHLAAGVPLRGPAPTAMEWAPTPDAVLGRPDAEQLLSHMKFHRRSGPCPARGCNLTLVVCTLTFPGGLGNPSKSGSLLAVADGSPFGTVAPFLGEQCLSPVPSANCCHLCFNCHVSCLYSSSGAHRNGNSTHFATEKCEAQRGQTTAPRSPADPHSFSVV